MSQRRPYSSFFVRGLAKLALAVVIAFVGLVTASLKSSEHHVPVSFKNVAASVHQSPAGYDDIMVTRVIDGDTLVLENKEHVRLIGIDTPESRKNEKAYRDSDRTGMDVAKIVQLGNEAKNFTKHLVEGQRVRLEFDVTAHDKYGRLLAYVYLKSDPALNSDPSYVRNDHNEVFVNATIMKSGYASPMTIPPNVKHADYFRELYSQARQEKRGLWHQPRLVQK